MGVILLLFLVALGCWLGWLRMYLYSSISRGEINIDRVIIKEMVFLSLVLSILNCLVLDIRINVNLSFCVSVRLNNNLCLNFIVNRCVSKVSIVIFMVIKVIIEILIKRGWFCSNWKLMLVFIVIKNNLSSSFLKGLIFIFNLCWNLFLVNIILVRKLFRVGDSLIVSIR